MRSHSSRSVPGTVLYTPIPALLQTRSSLPYSATAAATARCTPAGSETSPCTNMTRPPAFRISSAVRSPSAWLLSSVTRAAPSLANSSAPARPIPVAVPVSRPTRPCSLGITRSAPQRTRSARITGSASDRVVAARLVHERLGQSLLGLHEDDLAEQAQAVRAPALDEDRRHRRRHHDAHENERHGSGHPGRQRHDRLVEGEEHHYPAHPGDQAMLEPGKLAARLAPHVEDDADVGHKVNDRDEQPGEVAEIAESRHRAPEQAEEQSRDNPENSE